MHDHEVRAPLEDVAYYSLVALFYLAPRLLYDIHIAEDEPATFPPSTLIVTNHKRDLDSVILPATLFWLNRTRAPLSFAGREDMFVRGFLAQFDVVPRWFRRLLHTIDLRAVMRALRIYPVRRFPERTMYEALHETLEVLGDRPLRDVLLAEEVPPTAGASERLSGVLGWEWFGAWRGPARMRAFQQQVREELYRRQREVVDAQMHALAGVLDAGGVLYLAPEGVISLDGRLQAFRSGLRQILELVRVPIRLHPVCIVYDFMRPGPLRVCITIGVPSEPAGPPEVVEAEQRRALAALHVMTATQVCSAAVWDWTQAGETVIEPRGLERAVLERAAVMQSEGMRIDPAFSRASARSVKRWLSYAQRHGIVVPRGESMVINTEVIASQPPTHWENPIRYAVNEVQSVRAVLRAPESLAVSSTVPT